MKKLFLLFVPALFLFLGCQKDKNQNGNNKNSINPVNAPFDMPDLKKPQIPDKDFLITDYGAKKGGDTLNSDAFRKAIQAASKNGGGRVIVPEGKWLTGPIHLESNINLHVKNGAEVLFSQNFDHYLPPVIRRHEGVEVFSLSPFIYAWKKKNIMITGNGVFNGQGNVWAEHRDKYGKEYSESVNKTREMAEKGIPVRERRFDDMEKRFLYPSFFQPMHCKNVWVEGVDFKFGAFWTVNPTYCENVVIRHVDIVTYGPYGEVSNGDGINPSSCKNVLIEHCTFDTGDDCIAIKSGRDHDGRRVGIPTENVVIRHCKALRGHGGVVIGSEMSGGIKNIYAHDLKLNGTDRMIRIKSSRGRGGYVKNAWYENMHADTLEDEVVLVNLLYFDKRYPLAADSVPMPEINNIHVNNVSCNYAKERAIQLRGVPEKFISGIHLQNVTIGSEEGINIQDADSIFMKNVTINNKKEPVVNILNARDIFIDSLTVPENTSLLANIMEKGSENININLTNPDNVTTLLKAEEVVNKNSIKIK